MSLLSTLLNTLTKLVARFFRQVAGALGDHGFLAR